LPSSTSFSFHPKGQSTQQSQGEYEAITEHHFYVSELPAKVLNAALKSKITPKPCDEDHRCNCTWTTNYTQACISNAADCLQRLLGSTTSHKIIRVFAQISGNWAYLAIGQDNRLMETEQQ
jgi:hypothetical protein